MPSIIKYTELDYSSIYIVNSVAITRGDEVRPLIKLDLIKKRVDICIDGYLICPRGMFSRAALVLAEKRFRGEKLSFAERFKLTLALIRGE